MHDRFVFLQLRKTGSTFVAEALRRELPEGACDDSLGKHADWSRIPAEATGKPVLVYVRNPWDWYVSWYHFNQMLGGTPNGYWRMLSNGGESGFKQTVTNACELSRRIMGADLYSTLFRNLVGDGLYADELTVGRFESLFDDLGGFLTTVGVEVPDGGMERIRAAPPLKSSSHRPYAEYYDEELRELVGDSCRCLVERFGYGF